MVFSGRAKSICTGWVLVFPGARLGQVEKRQSGFRLRILVFQIVEQSEQSAPTQIFAQSGQYQCVKQKCGLHCASAHLTAVRYS